MKAHYLDYSETQSFSPAIIRYLANDPELESFYNYKADIEGFRKLIQSKKNTAPREVLSASLNEQYQRLGQSPGAAVSHNIAILRDPNTYTVTTGHQLNLFTGPLYFIFKIVTAINLAKELKVNFPDKNFVPVYWMATEDHDFAEINHTYIAEKKISWDFSASGATGRINTKEIGKTLRTYTATLGASENAAALSRLMTKAYTEHETLADATRSAVNELFEEFGLVIIDADDATLKKEFSDIMLRDIHEQNSFRTISETIEKLANAGIQPQVNPREINFFYLTDGLRERIVLEMDLYEVQNSSIRFTADELEREIKNYPERFSPNVVTRPLYQEVILPNLCYIGGAAEIVYWLELKATFNFYGVDFPILLLRNSAVLASNNLFGKLDRLDLEIRDIFKPTEVLRKEWVKKHSAHELSLAAELKQMEEIFGQLSARASRIDPTLGPSSEAVRARLYHSLGNLEKKMVKAEKRNFADALSQIDSVKEKLFPGGTLQERKQNFGPFYVKHGKDFIRQLLATLKPLDTKFTILEG